MPSVTVYAKDFAAFDPAKDVRRQNTPSVITGQNFLSDVDGPRSAFTSNFANWWQFGSDTRSLYEFRVSDALFYGSSTGLWVIDPVSRIPTLLIPVSSNRPYWPWTYAQVGNLHYFAQYNIPLMQYNALTGELALVPTPENVKGICLSYGRLVCLGSSTVFWSSLDDGTDFLPSLTTGAGFQALSILSRNAFRLDPVADGVVIATDKGWIKGEFVQANFVFRWYVRSTAVKIFSANAGVVIPDIGLIQLDPTGFHLSDGGVPQPWQPEMGAYLQATFLNSMRKNLHGLLRLSYVTSLNCLFVSIAGNTREGSYQIAFVYSLVTGKWGSFNVPHHSIISLDIPPLLINTAGYMDTQGYMRYFTEAQFSENVPSDGSGLADRVWRLSSEPNLLIVGTVHTASVEIITTPEDPALFGDYVNTALYKIVGGVASGYALPKAPPNSFVDLGPFRFAEQKEADEESMVTTLLVGVSAVASGTVITEDYNAETGSENWGEIS